MVQIRIIGAIRCRLSKKFAGWIKNVLNLKLCGLYYALSIDADCAL